MLDDLMIEASEDTPKVTFQAQVGNLSLHGRSLPEDAFAFYDPLIQWLSTYVKSPASETQVVFNLEYYNTASAKQIFKIAGMLTNLSKTNPVKVMWHYDEGDRDMQASGQRFSKLCGMAFELVKN